MPANPFKTALQQGRTQFGLWASLASPLATEACAGSGADWVVIDGEHAPNDIRSIGAQLQAIGAKAHPIVRPPMHEAWFIKQILDLGAQTLMVPTVETVAQAQALVSATRYPPRGKRGVASAISRASDFGRDRDYLATADDSICLLVMIETGAGIDQSEAILAVDGVDGAFFGAADLAADLGHLGEANHPDVIAAVEHGIAAARRAGKGAGAFATPKTARRLIELGARFLSVAADVTLLAQGADKRVRAVAEACA